MKYRKLIIAILIIIAIATLSGCTDTPNHTIRLEDGAKHRVYTWQEVGNVTVIISSWCIHITPTRNITLIEEEE